MKHKKSMGQFQCAGSWSTSCLEARAPGMRAFPRVAALVFLLGSAKNRQRVRLRYRPGCPGYERWAGRCLSLPRELAPEFWSALLPELAALGTALVPHPERHLAEGLRTQAGQHRSLAPGRPAGAARVRTLPVASGSRRSTRPADQWHDQPCPSYRCRRGRLVAGDRPEGLGVHHRDRDYTRDYYRSLYRAGRQVPGGHRRAHRHAHAPAARGGGERLRAATGFKDPNVLSCTPTLEMGIDIGDLSAVVLAALPRRRRVLRPAGGAGRPPNRQRVPADDPRTVGARDL